MVDFSSWRELASSSVDHLLKFIVPLLSQLEKVVLCKGVFLSLTPFMLRSGWSLLGT